jgi:hypothetical protein
MWPSVAPGLEEVLERNSNLAFNASDRLLEHAGE